MKNNFESIQKPVEEGNELERIKNMAQNGDSGTAMEFIDSMDLDEDLESRMRHALGKFLVDGGYIDEALSVAQKMQNPYGDDLIRACVRQYINEGELEKGEEVFLGRRFHDMVAEVDVKEMLREAHSNK